jgi:hypothetical protein
VRKRDEALETNGGEAGRDGEGAEKTAGLDGVYTETVKKELIEEMVG